MKNMLFIGLSILIGTLISCSSSDERFIYAENNVAVEGYDLVAYVMDNDALKGKEENKVEYQGVDFYFTRPSYRDEFLKNPELYLPAFGGFCGYEIAQNSKKVASDPSVWIIQEGRLIFFSDTDQLEGKHKAEWVVNRREFLKKADKNWERMK
jgi:YHS domain-containing protein